MKANDRQIEALLRRHARRGKAASAAGVAQAQASPALPHLDADELNALAVGALSEAARARYSAHLADCDRCRALIIQLTLAAGTTQDRLRATEPKPPWFAVLRENLARLFTPWVWRYAAPALALIAFAGFMLVAVRNERRGALVAQNEVNERPLGAPVPSAEPLLAENKESATAQSAGRARASNEQPKQRTTTAPKTAADRDLDSKRVDAAEEQAARAQNPTHEYSPPPPEERAAERKEQESEKASAEPSAAAKTEPSGQFRATQTKQANESAREGGRGGAEEKSAGKDKTAAAQPRAKTSETAKRPAGALAGVLAPPQSSVQTTAADESSTETRRVSGHRFRRQRNVWVDTAYTSSMSLVKIARGSEEYKSLTADESGLRKIVEQLSGEVIVVWKGKAYRIR